MVEAAAHFLSWFGHRLLDARPDSYSDFEAELAVTKDKISRAKLSHVLCSAGASLRRGGEALANKSQEDDGPSETR